MIVFYQHIEDAERKLRDCKESYLRRWGWALTCSTPGAYWLWTRDFAREDDERRRNHERRDRPGEFRPYGVVMADLDLAVSMTVRSLDDQPELDDDEDGAGQ